MQVLGVTGGIASGKTTLRDILRELAGAEVFDADLEAKDILQHDPEAVASVVGLLGAEAYRQDGSPNKAWIRARIFESPSRRQGIEQILHPRVHARRQARAALRESGLLLVDMPLLFESGADRMISRTVTVACSPEVQFRRLAERGMKPALAQSIVESQWPTEKKVRQSTHVIWNDGPLEGLRAQARLLIDQ